MTTVLLTVLAFLGVVVAVVATVVWMVRDRSEDDRPAHVEGGAPREAVRSAIDRDRRRR